MNPNGTPPSPTPFAPPPVWVPPPEPKRRGALLTIMLTLKAGFCVIALIAAGIAVNALSHASMLLAEEHELARGLAKLLFAAIALAMIELVGVMATWAWRRWGAGILVCSSALVAMINMRVGSRAVAALEIASLVLVAMAIFLKWRDFE